MVTPVNFRRCSVMNRSSQSRVTVQDPWYTSVTGVPSLLVVKGAGGVIPKDETQVLLVIAVLWAIAVAVAAFAYRSVTTAARNMAFANRTAGSPIPPPEP
jgi:hypothetical protein